MSNEARLVTGLVVGLLGISVAGLFLSTWAFMLQRGHVTGWDWLSPGLWLRTWRFLWPAIVYGMGLGVLVLIWPLSWLIQRGLQSTVDAWIIRGERHQSYTRGVADGQRQAEQERQQAQSALAQERQTLAAEREQLKQDRQALAERSDALEKRTQALKDAESRQKATIDARVQQGVAAAESRAQAAEHERDRARAQKAAAEEYAAGAERRRRNAISTAERRRRKIERLQQAVSLPQA